MAIKYKRLIPNNLSYDEFIEKVDDPSNSYWKSKDYVYDLTGLVTELQSIWFHIYKTMVIPTVEEYFYEHKLYKMFSREISKYFNINYNMVKHGVINHLGLEALLDPYNTFSNVFSKTYIIDMIDEISDSIMMNYGPMYVNCKYNEDGTYKTAKLTYREIFDKFITRTDTNFTITSASKQLTKMIIWCIRCKLNVEFLKYLSTPINYKIKYIMTDIEMFYTRNIMSVSSQCKYIKNALDMLSEIKTRDPKVQAYNLSNYLTTVSRMHANDDKQKMFIVQELSRILKSSEFKLDFDFIEELISFTMKLQDEYLEKFNNVYNYDVIKDLDQRLFDKNNPSSPGYFDDFIDGGM